MMAMSDVGEMESRSSTRELLVDLFRDFRRK